MRPLFVFGTRPEALKLVLLIKQFKNPVICVTGQHNQMLYQALKLFNVKPHYDLKVMKKNQTLFSITANILLKIEKVLEKEKPDVVIVQGDTTSAFAGALAAFYKKIPVAHVEAGLRTYDKYAPFPEEINRKLVTPIADVFFAPTKEAAVNLIKEAIPENKIFVTGNTKMILVTGHRRENFGQGFKNICHALKDIAKNNDALIIYPVHLNPNVQKPVTEILSNVSNIKLIPPMDYENFVYLMSKSHFIITDSGGVQEEAPSLKKPVLVMREVTERQEGVAAKNAILVGTDRKRIVKLATELLKTGTLSRRMTAKKNPYGDGQASVRIRNILNRKFS